MYSWNEICDRADGSAHLSPELKAKDEARWQVGRLMVDNGESDPEHDETPEESIERYCERFCIRFDESGNIAGYELPEKIVETVYRQKDDYYLKQDVINAIAEMFSESREMSLTVSNEQIDDIMRIYRHDADCNIPYNSTIENAIKQVLGE